MAYLNASSQLSNLSDVVKQALKKHEVVREFPSAVQYEANSFNGNVSVYNEAGENRVDLTHLPFVTIDDANSKDFDDAVYCVRDNNGWTLYVAIADVSWFVRPNTALDREAFRRGCSIYVANEVIPMLPSNLSDNACSLLPHQNRFCLTCEMKISFEGALKGYKFYPSVIRSAAKLTYDAASRMIESGRPYNLDEANVMLPIHTLHDMYCSRHAYRHEHTGFVDISRTEVCYIPNNQGGVEDIRPKVNNESHHMIEECMITANICAAMFVQKYSGSLIYRVQDNISISKLSQLNKILANNNITIGCNREAYNKYLQSIKNSDNRGCLERLFLRSTTKACYSTTNGGHYMLNQPSYTHFTSPIRRYSDLVIHRLIKYSIDVKASLGAKNYSNNELEAIAQKCNEAEMKASSVAHDINHWMECKYLSSRIGNVYNGTIIAVETFGLFVMLDGVGIDGFVYVGSLGTERFGYNSYDLSLSGSYGKKYYAGMRVTVRLQTVDMLDCRAKFIIV